MSKVLRGIVMAISAGLAAPAEAGEGRGADDLRPPPASSDPAPAPDDDGPVLPPGAPLVRTSPKPAWTTIRRPSIRPLGRPIPYLIDARRMQGRPRPSRAGAFHSDYE